MSYYSEYKTSELFQVIQASDFSEEEYDDLKNELEASYELNQSEPKSDASERVCALIRFAIKHLCRVYPTFGVSQYMVTGMAHGNPNDVVHREVDATHDEQAKFYFHTQYNHKEYKVTDVTKLSN